MKTHPAWILRRAPRVPSLTLAGLLTGITALPAQVTNNIQSFTSRVPVGDPATAASDGAEGPKGIATADFDGDGRADIAAGNLDGTITVLRGQGGGQFSPPLHLQTNADELRAVLAEDFTGDGRPDIAAASPMDGRLLLFVNDGGGGFAAPRLLPAWTGVRNLAGGDFDGDGVRDLAAAGPGLGLRHYRGTGGGEFEIMGDLPQLSPAGADIPRPVYTLRPLRSLDGQRDDLLLTHAESPALYILSTAPANRSAEPAVNPATLPAWRNHALAVVMSEVQLNNATTLRDADGEAHPWMELLNKSDAAVTLTGWTLHNSKSLWQLPAVTIPPGRFLVIFLSGKSRTTGAELHAPFALTDDHESLTLAAPGGASQMLLLPEHTGTDISTGLAVDVDRQVWFDIPSPGATNNAGFNNPDDAVNGDAATSLTISPRHPGAGDAVTVTVRTPAQLTGNTALRAVWFSTTTGVTEQHHLLKRTAAGEHTATLPAGVFQSATPHRVLAKYATDGGAEFGDEIHPGLDDGTTSSTAPPRPGRLLPVASVPSPKVRAFEVTAVRRQPGPGVLPDLVYADDVCGLLRVHRSVATAQRFEAFPAQDLQVRGSPRDVKLADLDGDGWQDALVVLRELDLALSFRNDAGVLRPTGEYPTGRSPREAVLADFSGDGRPDAAVINRFSADISILTTAPGQPGLVSLDQVYPVDGEVTGIVVTDHNRDGRDDVMQLHRASGEVSVRLSGPDGILGAPSFITMPGARPSSMATADVNNDGVTDTITADLGFTGNTGTISVQLSQPGGGFTQSTVPGDGPMFAISVNDFDADGNLDLVTGLFDCRVTFFKGDGTGTFLKTRSIQFAYESRVMVTGDFDQDGDTDVAGAGADGNVVVLENQGSLHTGPYGRQAYPPPSQYYFGAERIGLTNMNADSDPDLVVGSGRGCMVYLGGPGMTFTFSESISNSTPPFSVSDVVTLDLDGNGTLEMVVACRAAACVNILTQSTAGGPFAVVSQANVPSSRYLAQGDLDGDGKPDLVGTGDALWTVLSSRPPQIAPPGSTETTRPVTTGLLINEVLSRNTGTPVSSDAGRKTDFVELYNSTTATVNAGGWKLKVESNQEGVPFSVTHTLPPSVPIPAGGRHVVLWGADLTVNPAYTGSTLPAEAGTITLLQPDNTVADTTQVPASLDNVSWSRYRDGHPVFRADGIPSPGLSNLDNGSVPPEIKLTAPSTRTMRPGMPLPFTARGKDDSGIVSLSLLWKPVGSAADAQRVVLYDDGQHADGAAVDGFFAGLLAPGLPPGTEVQFYMEATDLSGNTVRVPEEATLTGPGQAPVAWTFSLSTPPTLSISSITPVNYGLRDEKGGTPPYIKVRNHGTVPVSMAGVQLAKSPLSSAAAAYSFPAHLTLAPGAEATVFADDDAPDGPMHAPFTLNAAGDDIALLALTPSGARQWIQALTVPAQPAFSSGSFQPIPGSDRWGHWNQNDASAFGLAYDEQGQGVPFVWVRTLPGMNYRVEGERRQPDGTFVWETMDTFSGDGSVRSYVHTEGLYVALRILGVPPLPVVQSVRSMQSGNRTDVFIHAPGATGVTVFTDGSDKGTVAADWQAGDGAAGSADGWFTAIIPDRHGPGSTFAWRVRAMNSSGESWSGPGQFVRGSNDSPRLINLTRTALNSSTMTAEASFYSSLTPASVRMVFGPVDQFENETAWPYSVTAAGPGGVTFRATAAGLTPGVEYYARFIATMSDGTKVVSGSRLAFHAATAAENMTWNLRMTEVMYHPSPPTAAEAALGYVEDDFEWFELLNDSDAPMDLTGCWWTGIGFDFPAPAGPVIAPGQRVVIAAHPHAFALRHGSQIPVMAWTMHPFRTGRLSNGGESLMLYGPDGTLRFWISYNDLNFADDGGGFTLDAEAPGAAIVQSVPGTDRTWSVSRLAGGTPGQPGVPHPSLTFAAWQPTVFSPAQMDNFTISGDNADPDTDGLTNRQEYLYGTPPLTAGAHPLEIASAGTANGVQRIRLTFPVNPHASSGQVFADSLPADAAAWQRPVTPLFSNGSANQVSTGAFLHLPLHGGSGLECSVILNVVSPRTLYRLRSAP